MKYLFALWASVFLAMNATAQSFDHSHAGLTALLKKHVVAVEGGKATQVRYKDLLKERDAFKKYLDGLSAVSSRDFEVWSKSQQMAFLINAYNAFTLELILQNYPVKSIRDIGGFLDDRWNRKFFKLLGKDTSLNQIEHDMLRAPGRYNEVRIHFAVNCASVSCPPLREEAYVAEQLDRQLEEQAARFLGNKKENRYINGRLEVSMIFNWYKDDWAKGYTGFEGKSAPVTSREAWFARYAHLLADDAVGRKNVGEGKASISHLDYDWNLNESK